MSSLVTKHFHGICLDKENVCYERDGWCCVVYRKCVSALKYELGSFVFFGYMESFCIVTWIFYILLIENWINYCLSFIMTQIGFLL